MAKRLWMALLAIAVFGLGANLQAVQAAEGRQSVASFTLMADQVTEPVPPEPTESLSHLEFVPTGSNAALPATGNSANVSVAILGLLVLVVVGRARKRGGSEV
ncbi:MULTISPECIES: LPXTG cell wall anchor domain-containing protein [unclassified Lacticaseibacillus]|uniref:LPXTG cell wall anchor domain-containing protein n=1 Tax=unclassified Lacticaseibacillus TaxID=2759744 RepID=UPI001940F212|nr:MULTISPECIES: LPXTG cell wall anchor domain-containing protein [unclassified Lacticaseibacillus]